MERRLAGAEKNVPARLGGKRVIREFCDLIGINTPSVLQVDILEKLDQKKLPEYFVLKPSFASTSIGVYLLKKSGNNFFDILKNKEYTWNEIKTKCNDVAKRYFGENNETAIFIIEELLIDGNGKAPPDDIRFYAFQGEIGLILKEDHMTSNRVESMYFDGNFLPFTDLENRYSIAETAKNSEIIIDAIVPENWQALLNVAKRISYSVPTAFARIDLYDTPKGIYLGEVTLTPGTFYYKNRKLMSKSEASRLGRLWLDAEKRMQGSKGY
ncbi:hypothetical protein QWA_15712 [Alcaligenes faecalis subsp. faecalis NCIB 8687]|nr:hypothetical protein QWA_15712 [Alcaligenes faecalis subsp. faecalis NCIB 8687]